MTDEIMWLKGKRYRLVEEPSPFVVEGEVTRTRISGFVCPVKELTRDIGNCEFEKLLNKRTKIRVELK